MLKRMVPSKTVGSWRRKRNSSFWIANQQEGQTRISHYILKNRSACHKQATKLSLEMAKLSMTQKESCQGTMLRRGVLEMLENSDEID